MTMRTLQLLGFFVLAAACAVLFQENRHANERLAAVDLRLIGLEDAMAPQVARLKALEQGQEAMQPKLDLIGMIIKDQQPRTPGLVRSGASSAAQVLAGRP